jgi:hypothetical protein
MKRLRMAFFVLVVAGSLLPVRATKPEHITCDSYADFAKGTSLSVSISETGVLEPAPELTKIGDVEAEQIWSILLDGKGSFLVATSPEGKLYRLNSHGKAEVVIKFAETHLYAMARSPSGDVFVGTSPDGKIYRINAKGKSSVYFEPNEKYIWCLAFDKSGALYAGTGINGKIYRITREGSGEVYYQSDETHIRSLAFDREGRLLAGSAESGNLYRIARSGEGVVLSSTNRQEINQIAVDPSGVIYFSALGSVKTPTTPSAAKAALTISLNSARSGHVAGESEEPSKASTPATPAPAPTNKAAPANTAISHLYRLDSSLYAADIWSSKDTILTLNCHDKRVYVGTGGEGYFYAVNERGQATRLLKVEGETISACARLNDGSFVLAASNPAQLFQVGSDRHIPGVYESDVIDSSLFARWGVVIAKGNGQVQIRTRSGNTQKPDKSWYEWLPLENEVSESLPARYLQVELQLLAGSKVDRFEAYFLPKNLPPHIEQVEILPPGVGFTAIAPAPATLQAKSAEQVFQAAAKTDADAIVKAPARFQPSEARGLRTMAWKATDPNSDELLYSVFYRTENKNEWRLLAKELKETVLSWDTSGWPDGNYYLKVVASDATDNAPDEALTDEMTSRLLTVNNTPPLIQVMSVIGGRVEFTVQAAASRLASVQVSSNGKDFKPLRPEDGILDQRFERFETKVEPGEVLFIRVEDESGNVSSAMAQRPAR